MARGTIADWIKVITAHVPTIADRVHIVADHIQIITAYIQIIANRALTIYPTMYRL